MSDERLLQDYLNDILESIADVAPLIILFLVIAPENVTLNLLQDLLLDAEINSA